MNDLKLTASFVYSEVGNVFVLVCLYEFWCLMKTTIDFWCDQILIWSACLWAHQKFSEILSPGPAQSHWVAVSWRAGRTILVFGFKSFLCPCVLHCIYVSFQCRTIYKNITGTLLQLQVYRNKLNFVVVSLTKLAFGHFSSLTKLWSVQTPRLEPPDATNTSAGTAGHQVPKLLQKASDEQSDQILKSTVGVYTVWHIDADNFT